MTQPALQVRQLVKRYGGIVATDHVDLSIAPGEVHALIGPNGAGKTTFLNQLAGSLCSDGGSIEFWGRDITRLPIHRRVLIGLARSHQLISIFGRYTVLHNVLLAVQARHGTSFRFHGSPFREALLVAEAREVLATVGLSARESALTQSLSYGEQRRVEIALALATRPSVLLLDEPLAGVAAADAAAMIELISGLRTEATIVLVEHDMHAVFRLADRITVMVDGKTIATGFPSEIRASPLVRQAYLGEEATH